MQALSAHCPCGKVENESNKQESDCLPAETGSLPVCLTTELLGREGHQHALSLSRDHPGIRQRLLRDHNLKQHERRESQNGGNIREVKFNQTHYCMLKKANKGTYGICPSELTVQGAHLKSLNRKHQWPGAVAQ